MSKRKTEAGLGVCPYDISANGIKRNAIDIAGCSREQCKTCGFNPVEHAKRVEKIRSGDMGLRAVVLKDESGKPVEAKVCRTLVIKKAVTA